MVPFSLFPFRCCVSPRQRSSLLHTDIRHRICLPAKAFFCFYPFLRLVLHLCFSPCRAHVSCDFEISDLGVPAVLYFSWIGSVLLGCGDWDVLQLSQGRPGEEGAAAVAEVFTHASRLHSIARLHAYQVPQIPFLEVFLHPYSVSDRVRSRLSCVSLFVCLLFPCVGEGSGGVTTTTLFCHRSPAASVSLQEVLADMGAPVAARGTEDGLWSYRFFLFLSLSGVFFLFRFQQGKGRSLLFLWDSCTLIVLCCFFPILSVHRA